MSDFNYAKGRISESLNFIFKEINEFESDYLGKTWHDYQDDTKLQKLMDRTIENILTALIEISGTILTQEGTAVENYCEALKKCSQNYGFTEEESTNLAKFALQRNRLAHRYLDFRWQAIKMFVTQKEAVKKLLTLILKNESINREKQ
ncbi:MAG: HepT-like ribonuclease domain-containing protein [bacterium]